MSKGYNSSAFQQVVLEDPQHSYEQEAAHDDSTSQKETEKHSGRDTDGSDALRQDQTALHKIKDATEGVFTYSFGNFDVHFTSSFEKGLESIPLGIGYTFQVIFAPR